MGFCTYDLQDQASWVLPAVFTYCCTKLNRCRPVVTSTKVVSAFQRAKRHGADTGPCRFALVCDDDREGGGQNGVIPDVVTPELKGVLAVGQGGGVERVEVRAAGKARVKQVVAIDDEVGTGCVERIVDDPLDHNWPGNRLT